MNHSYNSSAPPPPEGKPPLHVQPYTDDDESIGSDPRFRPMAPPPSAPPATPPPTPPSWRQKKAPEFKENYGTSQQSSSSYHDTNGDSGRGLNSFRGDATLRPNVGLTNSYEYALFGWTLQELVVNLRYLNLGASTLTLFYVAFAWIGKVFTFQWGTAVILGYLSVLSFALFLVELMGFYRTQLSQRGITSNSTHTFVMEEHIRDQLGLLYHPGGKAGYVFFLAVLCWSLKMVTLRLIALAYCFSAFGYIYAFNTYPEFRQGGIPRAPSNAAASRAGFWNRQAWTTTSIKSDLAEAAARNWSSRWGLGTGPEEEPNETESFLRHNQANQNYTYV
mmetsp:Transcript_15329/g.31159  ORF Transcript_15329/g.31159 Transcript_15329/m.31159 type:complete len:334 (+) Transcript_15329:231-1232(+)